jgi:hypothetical protein
MRPHRTVRTLPCVPSLAPPGHRSRRQVVAKGIGVELELAVEAHRRRALLAHRLSRRASRLRGKAVQPAFGRHRCRSPEHERKGPSEALEPPLGAREPHDPPAHLAVFQQR